MKTQQQNSITTTQFAELVDGYTELETWKLIQDISPNEWKDYLIDFLNDKLDGFREMWNVPSLNEAEEIKALNDMVVENHSWVVILDWFEEALVNCDG